MAGGKIVKQEQVALLPPVEDHILVDCLANLVHFKDGNGPRKRLISNDEKSKLLFNP